MPAPDADWLALCRRCAAGARAALERFETAAERAAETGRGEGGDMALAIDRAAEDAVFAELEALGTPLTAISEERGRVELAGGGPLHVIVDPVDGSLNAKRRLPFAALSIAVAEGNRMADVAFGYVAGFGGEGEWWAERGGGARRDGEPVARRSPGPLEVLALETVRPGVLAEAAPAVAAVAPQRIRALGSVAISLCLVADGRIDAVASLRGVRSVDAAAGQLIAREAGAAVSFPDAGDGEASLDLSMRSRVLAARDGAILERLRAALG
jgi:myo-inositol-1(or 4)-monophosphatase